MQKATYLMQELFDVALDFDFTLYKHGPFSFDLRDELTALRADEYLRLEVMPMPYGPRLEPTERAEQIQGQFEKTVKSHDSIINFIATTVDSKGVEDLEGLATALYVTRNLKTQSVPARAKELNEIKPHISLDRAADFMREIDRVIAEAAKV